MKDLSNTYGQIYRKSGDYSGYCNFDGDSLRRAKLGLITIPCVRSNNAFNGRSSGYRFRFIRLGLNDIESRTKCHKASFNSGYTLLNKHPHCQGVKIRSLRDLLNVFNRL